ncbi:MAG: hypothetical protein ABI411_01965 [Tahibacter sp.]
MSNRQALALELDTLQRRLRELVAVTPGSTVFWAMFERKRQAIERGASPSDLDFVRFRINSMLAAEQLIPGCVERSVYA